MWEEVVLIDQNGVITMYEVMYTPLETSGRVIGTGSKNVTYPSTSVVLTDLEEYVFYNISITAYTQVGQGNYSSPITERTDEDGKVLITSRYIYIYFYDFCVFSLVDAFMMHSVFGQTMLMKKIGKKYCSETLKKYIISSKLLPNLHVNMIIIRNNEKIHEHFI